MQRTTITSWLVLAFFNLFLQSAANVAADVAANFSTVPTQCCGSYVCGCPCNSDTDCSSVSPSDKLSDLPSDSHLQCGTCVYPERVCASPCSGSNKCGCACASDHDCNSTSGNSCILCNGKTCYAPLSKTKQLHMYVPEVASPAAEIDIDTPLNLTTTSSILHGRPSSCCSGDTCGGCPCHSDADCAGDCGACNSYSNGTDLCGPRCDANVTNVCNCPCKTDSDCHGSCYYCKTSTGGSVCVAL